MSEGTVQVLRFEDDPGDDSGGRSAPPIWVVVVVVLAVVTGGWLLVSQGSTDNDVVTSTTPDDISVVTPTTFSPNEAEPVSDFGNPPISLTAETPEQLRGYVAVTSPDDPPFIQDAVWVFRPGGDSVVSSDNGIERVNVEYPMLITAGYLMVASEIFDIDLAEPPLPFSTNGTLIPGSGPGEVWLEQSQGAYSGRDFYPYHLWVSRVDVESLNVGERIEVTDLFFRPVVGFADGLIVHDFNEDLALWSPTDGLVPLDLPGDFDTVVAVSGDFVVVATTESVDLVDIVSGEYAGSFVIDFDVPGARSACLSPDQQHVIVVGWNGDAVVGNAATGEVISLSDDGMSVQTKHGIGWTADDQLVFIADVEDSKHVFGFDIATGESFVIAQLNGSAPWWLTASGTVC